MRFFLTTLGCKVNQYESQVIRESWERLGHCHVDEASQAEVILVHSCAVTQKALADLRKNVAALYRAAPKAHVLITGCAAQTHGLELSRLAGVFRVFGLKDRERLALGPDELLAPKRSEGQETSLPFVLEGVGDFNRARAQVKIQDGCSHGCTYCIVPLARGGHQSRSPQEIVGEIRRLLEAGFRELCLIGINLRLYGLGLHPQMNFWDLVRLLEATFASQWAGRARFRMSSLDPAMLGAKALETIAASRMLCPHLHLSLQSASRDVLRRMGRGHYDPQMTYAFCEDLARVWPVFSLGADVLTGFPGEEDGHFRETLDFCSALPLSYAHVFPYSPRSGTPAAEWPDQVPQRLRQKRAKALRTLAQEKKEAFLNKLLDCRELTMVVEGQNPVQGKCEYYVPCQVQGAEVSLRSLIRVRPRAISSGMVLCDAATL